MLETKLSCFSYWVFRSNKPTICPIIKNLTFGDVLIFKNCGGDVLGSGFEGSDGHFVRNRTVRGDRIPVSLKKIKYFQRKEILPDNEFAIRVIYFL